MDKAQTIAKLVDETSLSTNDATKLVNERIAMLGDEETRKTVESELKLIVSILDQYTGVTEDEEIPIG